MATLSTADIVNTWFVQNLASGPLGRSTDAYNQVHGALPALIAALDAAAAPAPDAASAPAPDATPPAPRGKATAAAPADPAAA